MVFHVQAGNTQETLISLMQKSFKIGVQRFSGQQ